MRGFSTLVLRQDIDKGEILWTRHFVIDRNSGIIMSYDKYFFILGKLGKNLLLTVNKDKQLLSQPAQQPISDNQLWTVDQIQPDEYYLILKAGYLFLKFSTKGKSAYVTGNEGSDVTLVRHDPDIYVDIQDTAPPQYILGISEDNPAPGTPVVS